MKWSVEGGVLQALYDAIFCGKSAHSCRWIKIGGHFPNGHFGSVHLEKYADISNSATSACRTPLRTQVPRIQFVSERTGSLDARSQRGYGRILQRSSMKSGFCYVECYGQTTPSPSSNITLDDSVACSISEFLRTPNQLIFDQLLTLAITPSFSIHAF